MKTNKQTKPKLFSCQCKAVKIWRGGHRPLCQLLYIISCRQYIILNSYEKSPPHGFKQAKGKDSDKLVCLFVCSLFHTICTLNLINILRVVCCRLFHQCGLTLISCQILQSSHLLTPFQQDERSRLKSWWGDIKVERSLNNFHHRQDRFDLEKKK